MKIFMKYSRFLLILIFLLSSSYSLKLTLYLDDLKINDLGMIDLSYGDHFFYINIDGNFPIKFLNYSIDVKPDNFEKILQKMGLSEKRDIDFIATEEFEFPYYFKIPKSLCGVYKIKFNLYYEENDEIHKTTINKIFRISCKGIKSRIIYMLITLLPRGMMDYLLKFIY